MDGQAAPYSAPAVKESRAMSRHRVQCINKSDRYNPWERITHIEGANEDGSRWKLSQADAIEGTESDRWSFFVVKDGREVDVVVATSAHGNKYLKTRPDGDVPDNLLELPECR